MRKLDKGSAPIDSSGCTVHTIEDRALKEEVMKHSCRSIVGTLAAMTLMGLASPTALAEEPTAPPAGDVVAEQPATPPVAPAEGACAARGGSGKGRARPGPPGRTRCFTE